MSSKTGQRRLAAIASQATASTSAASASTRPKSDDDVVIVSACRTAIGRAKRGSFKETHPTDLLVAVLNEVIVRSKNVKKSDVEDIVVGNVLMPGAGATQARMASFLADFPETTAVTTLNRQCSSGLQAVANVAAAIAVGTIDIGIAAGVESMSLFDMMGAVGELNPKVFEHPAAQDCLLGMGQTSENVAKKYGITRETQDKMAVESNRRAAAAQSSGRFDAEIVPVKTKVTTPEGEEKEIVVSKDEGIRANTTLEGLAKLRPAFDENGTTTAGNSSQVSDGAAAVLLTKRSRAKAMGLPILGTLRSFAVVGVPPDVMGIGPAFAIPKALEKAGLQVSDIDQFEINEAFASQATYCVDKLGIDMSKVNPNGGAIALGHPLGCTGARQVSTLLYELNRNKQKNGVISMCIGTGMGAAAVLEAENEA